MPREVAPGVVHDQRANHEVAPIRVHAQDPGQGLRKKNVVLETQEKAVAVFVLNKL